MKSIIAFCALIFTTKGIKLTEREELEKLSDVKINSLAGSFD